MSGNHPRSKGNWGKGVEEPPFAPPPPKGMLLKSQLLRNLAQKSRDFFFETTATQRFQIRPQINFAPIMGVPPCSVSAEMVAAFNSNQMLQIPRLLSLMNPGPKEQQMATAGGHARGRQEHAEETYRAGDREWAWERRWVVRWQKQLNKTAVRRNLFLEMVQGRRSRGRGLL